MRLRHLLIPVILLASCYRDGDGCRPGGDDDDGEPEPAETCKPSDESCHGVAAPEKPE